MTLAQVETLFAAVDRHQRYFERLHERCLTAGFRRDDPLRRQVRACLLSLRELALKLNDHRPKGLSRMVMRASRSWAQP